MTLRTVTLSPGFDHCCLVDRLVPADVSEVISWHVHASGKGVNVARTAASLGVTAVAYSLIGDADNDEFVTLIERSGVQAVTVAVPGSTRRNLTIRTTASATAAAHAVGTRLEATSSDADELIARLLSDIEPGDLVTLNGATAQGVHGGVWAEVGAAAHQRGGTLLADVQGESLLRLLESGVVSMAKPNQDEALVLVGPATETSSLGAVGSALDRMEVLGVETPVVTLGARGAVHLEEGKPLHTSCPVDQVMVVVGAGDAFMAGYCAAMEGGGGWFGCDPVKLGVAVAAAHVSGAEGSSLQITARSMLDITDQRVGDLWS